MTKPVPWPRIYSKTTKDITVMFTVQTTCKWGDVQVPAGTRVVGLTCPSGIFWKVDELCRIKPPSPEYAHPRSMFMHDAVHYGIDVPADCVEETPASAGWPDGHAFHKSGRDSLKGPP